MDLGAIALPDPLWGKPAPRCDHLFSALEGFAMRADAAAPFPGGQPPSVDAWKGKWWLFSGHGFMSQVRGEATTTKGEERMEGAQSDSVNADAGWLTHCVWRCASLSFVSVIQ